MLQPVVARLIEVLCSISFLVHAYIPYFNWMEANYRLQEENRSLKKFESERNSVANYLSSIKSNISREYDLSHFKQYPTVSNEQMNPLMLSRSKYILK